MKISLEIIATLSVILAYVFLRVGANIIFSRVRKKFSYNNVREKIMKKIFNSVLFILSLFLILIIWGVEKDQIFYFVSSMLTVVGVAFVAQWSLLSNITASFILFFNHPMKIGEEIKILDKDYDIQGVVSDIGIFYLIIKTYSGDKITIPTNILMQKMVKTK
ncbi:MAG: mechanosensitive ion channel [Flavobacteriales bacterium]|nr:mechanosensitive ion channel [Flavobacteriales bacterium]MCB9197262.1 mechanosensitive ion channel [Flavobacteriales bacterium]